MLVPHRRLDLWHPTETRNQIQFAAVAVVVVAAAVVPNKNPLEFADPKLKPLPEG